MTITKIDAAKFIVTLKGLISEELSQRNISEAELGNRMELSQASVNKLKIGKYQDLPTIDTLEKVGIYFGMAIVDFINFVGHGAEVNLTSDEEIRVLRAILMTTEDRKLLYSLSKDILYRLEQMEMLKQQI